MTIGSGRRYRPEEVQPIVENAICLDLTLLKKHEGFKPGNCLDITYSANSQDIITLNIAVGKEFLSVNFVDKGKYREQDIKIISIPCFGIYSRQYLLCPACGTKRKQIYLGSDGTFSCRLCNGLGYRVQRLNTHMRHSYAAEKLWREKLKQPEGGPKNIHNRPKYLKNKTYFKAVEQIMAHERKSHEAFVAYFAKIQAGFAVKLHESNV